MKIIKPGSMPAHKFTCDMCDCEFIADFNEYTCSRTYNPFTNITFSQTLEAQCPCCGCQIIKYIDGGKHETI